MVSLRRAPPSYRRGQPKLRPLPARLPTVAAPARAALSPRRRGDLRRALAQRYAERSRSGQRRALYPQRTQPETRRCWRQSPSNFEGAAGRLGAEDERSAPTVRELQRSHSALVQRQIRLGPEERRADWAGVA